jgi:CubicO group peptidase (beta-lactamase class C family)
LPLIVGAAFSAHAQTAAVPPDAIIAASIRDFLRSHPADLGIAVGVISHGHNLTFAAGRLAAQTPASPTADTRYPIASITKTFTAALLVQASIDGKLTLADDPRRYIQGDYPNLAYHGHAIRLFDLLDHRSGLPFYLPDEPQAQPGDKAGQAPFLTRLAALRLGYTNADFYRDLQHVTLHRIPGSEPPQYSNAGADLVALLLERIYAMPYAALLQTTILDRLHMADTCMSAACKPQRDAPAGYDSTGRLLPDDTSPLGAAGALRSTVHDLLKYAAWQMNETDAVVARSHIPYAVIGDYSAALNWQMWTTHGRRVIWQSGNVPGFGSLCAMEMSTGTAVIILLNGSADAATDGKDELANRILRRLDPNAVTLP